MSCLFNSLALIVNLDPTVLRRVIVSYLRTNPRILDDLRLQEILQATDGKTVAQYSAVMDDTRAWGGCIELKAFCELFSYRVKIHVTYTGEEFDITPDRAIGLKGTIELWYTGDHYEVVNSPNNINLIRATRMGMELGQ